MTGEKYFQYFMTMFIFFSWSKEHKTWRPKTMNILEFAHTIWWDKKLGQSATMGVVCGMLVRVGWTGFIRDVKI